jgi:diguanylate cyclase (GGDEF)-like protein/PAS domain S-box-containing protein
MTTDAYSWRVSFRGRRVAILAELAVFFTSCFKVGKESRMSLNPSHKRSTKEELHASASLRMLIDSLPSEERYRAVVEQTADGIFLIDGTTKSILEANARFEELLGYGRGELHGMTLYDLVPHDREGARANVDRVLEQKSYHVGERSYRRKDGSLVDTEVSASLIEHDDKEILCCVARDMTERKRAEERLRESEERHRAVVEQSVEGIYLFNPEDRRVLEVNGAFEELTGYTSDELLGMTIYDFIAHEPEDIDCQVERSLKERRRHKGERTYRRKDGSSLDVEASAMVIPYCDGEAVCCVIHDVTERKASEEKLRKSKAGLAEAQRIAHLGNWEWDVKTGEVLWSDETFRIYGYEPQGFVPTFEKLMEVVHPDDRDLVRQNLDGALYEGEPYDFEHRIVRPNGEERVLHRQAQLYPDDEGQPQRMVGTVHDITEQKRAEEALKESEGRFRSAFENAPIGVALVGLDRRHLRVNRALCEMLGYSEEELLEKPHPEIVHPDDRDESTERIQEILEDGAKPYALERRYIDADGHIVWSLSNISLIRDSEGKPSHFVCLHQDITERKELEERLEHRAFYDSLTELPNRGLFLNRLGHALAQTTREDGPVAVLLLDLNHFKVINDSLGHDAGNTVLVEVAERMRTSMRPGDTVGRIFGDEFAVLLEAPSGAEEARRVAGRIQERLEEPFEVEGQEVLVSPSIGIALGESAQDRPEEVLRRADLAMYTAKKRSKAECEEYSPDMETQVANRMDLERDLRRAVEREEFEVHYQPIVELQTGELFGVEALARWRHPERGLVEAEEFIETAEETGLIRPIGQRIVEEACRQAEEWCRRYPQRMPMLSVNLSANQFVRQPDLIPKVLDETGLEPNALQVEITERTVMDDAEIALAKLKELKDLGVSLAIDDFGMGYSCLYHLKHMPIDFLKIDRAFIAGLGDDQGDEAIVAGTVGLAHALGVITVAEGVETADQQEILKELGCDLAQGYYFAKPLPREAMEQLLANHRP